MSTATLPVPPVPAVCARPIEVVGGGCAGLALAVAADAAGLPLVVRERRTADRPDTRSWCHWDTGDDLLLEAASHSWRRWEVLAPGGRAVASDPEHPYRLVRAADYRRAARARLAASPTVRLVEGDAVDAAADDPRGIDAAGRAPAVPAGAVLLHQRFLGQWIRSSRPVFDPGTATLMDFWRPRPDGTIRFLYVLPVEPALALVESTVITPDRHGDQPLRDEIADYLADRWGLDRGEWRVEDQEAGCIAMTDAPATVGRAIGVAGGDVRPSSGYAFGRIQRHARRLAADLAAGRDPAPSRDPMRTRLLDAVFLRFLRDEPRRAPEVFLRMVGGLPGDLVVRFLTERSSALDDLRLVLALPKAPFLRAARRTVRERAAAR